MSKLKRREFIAAGAAAAAGLTCLSQDLGAAILQAREAGKPLLTERNLNAFIKANPLSTAKGQQLSQEAIRDPSGFINKYFSLTEAQNREMASITEADGKKLIDVLTKVREQKGNLNVRMGPSRAGNFTQPMPAKSAHHSVPRPKLKSYTTTDEHGNQITVIIVEKEKD